MDLATPALDSVIPKLLQIAGDEYKLQKGVKKDLGIVAQQLEDIKAVLGLVSYVPREQLNSEVRFWVLEAQEISFHIQDIIDTFLVLVEAGDPSRLHRAKTKMMNLFRKANTHRDIASAVYISGALKEIKERLEDLTKTRKRSIIDATIDTPFAFMRTLDPRLAMYGDDTQLVGIEKPRDHLISMLSLGSGEAFRKIISVVGAAGLGKTTLARAVYKSYQVKFPFDDCVFVSIGRAPDFMKVFGFIHRRLSDVSYERSQITLRDYGVKRLIEEIRKILYDRRNLIVIDDIWEQESWEKIKSAIITENKSGSRIIVTTRNMEVAKEAGVVYKLQPLSYESSKKLLYTRIYGGEESIGSQLDEVVTDKILRRCDGIPLAIITMASLLVGKPRKVWLELSTIGFRHKGNRQVENTMKILSLSYYYLPLPLRPCLLYLSAFPEDQVIKKDTVIWMWIAEGFIIEKQGKSAFEIGEDYFNDLIDKSMIQASEIEFDGVIQGCRVHGIVLDFIRSLSYEEKFVFVLDEDSRNRPSGKVRWLALHATNEEHGLDLEHLRSVNAIGCPTYMIHHSRFSVLRVLTLEGCGSREGYNLEHLGKLFLLRFLGLRNTLVGKLPEEIGRLKFLQTLMLEGSGVEELPESMGGLSELMCFNADWKTRVPDWIGKLTSLQQLEMYPGGGDDDSSTKSFVNELGKLTQLRVLRFMIKVQDEGQIRDLLKSLSNLSNLQVIHFDYYGAQFNEALWTEFVVPAHLRSMELGWMAFSRLPMWINPRHLRRLRHLWLMLSDVDKKDLQTLGEFPLLSYLHLVLVNAGRGEIITLGDGAFQELKFCSITKPLKFQDGAMPRLEVLHFHFNVRLLKDAEHNFNFDFGLGNLSSLQQVSIECNSSAAFPEEVEQADAALKQAIDIHPNCHTIEISWSG